MHSMKELSNDGGLTLVELLIVIALVGIVAAIAVPVLVGALDQASMKAEGTSALERARFVESWTSSGYRVESNGQGWDAFNSQDELIASIH